MENENRVYFPSFWRRIIMNIVARGQHDPLKPLPIGFKEGITLVVGAKFGIKDRLRILLGGEPNFRVSIATENKPGEHCSFQTSLIIKANGRLSNKYYGMLSRNNVYPREK
jgi:hypothetical protein